MNELQIVQNYLQHAREQYKYSIELAGDAINILLKKLNHNLSCYYAQCSDDENGSYAETLEDTILAFVRNQTPADYNINKLMEDIKNAVRKDAEERCG